MPTGGKGDYMLSIIRYDELKVGNVIRFHGANEIVVDVWDEGESEYYPGEKIIRFELRPYDEEAIKILGNFYSKGVYGGVGFLTVGLVK